MVAMRRIGWVLLASACAVRAAAAAETVTVVASTPLPGTSLAVDRLPETVETLAADDLSREGAPSLTRAMNDELGSINVNDDLDDPFQPDILYRGFEASPVLGTPQGLAVYQNGVRINEAFGDAVNWDLVPDTAVARLDVVSAEPVYGLNALGGAVIVTMKDGFAFASGKAEAGGGSWGRREASLEYGGNDGTLGFYVAARLAAVDGWREFSPDLVRQFYADGSYRAGDLSLDLGVTAADNQLSGESPSPVQELAVDRALVFTNPQNMRNRLLLPVLNGAYAATATLSLQANLYFRDFHQAVVNGNTTSYTACTAASELGELCQPDGVTTLLDQASAPIPDLSQGGTVPIGETDFEWIGSAGWGATVQATESATLLGRENQLSTGASFDRDSTQFRSSAEVGTIDRALQVSRSGYFVYTPEGAAGSATPVGLDAVDGSYGIYATDTFDLSPDAAVTASGRYNSADIALADQRGAALTGRSRYARFNSAVGATEALSADATAFAGYSEGNRVPTPGEIECADPAAPCLLPSSLSSDPPTLRQVVSHNWEAGMRGRESLDAAGAGLAWHVSLFRTNVDDDIYGVATSLGSGYFRNIGETRRQGVEAAATYTSGRLRAFANYGFVEATFQSPLVLPSPLNTGADSQSDIHVRPGDTLPGIPRQRLKAGLDYGVTPRWSIGAVLVLESAQFLRGDESNQTKPLGGYGVLNLHSAYRIADHFELFVDVANAFDAKYATFGELGDPTGVDAPGVPSGAGATDRFESPAAPRGVYGGIRIET